MKNTLIISAVVLTIIGGAFYIKNAQPQKDTMMKKEDTVMEKTETDATEAMEKKDTAQEKPDTMMKKESRYVDYTAAAFEKAKDKKRIYFFHATWCPTCKAANAEFMSNPDGIPEDTVLFKTDYDSSGALKKQYGITYQHTYVLVDSDGKEVRKWNGGAIAELIANTK